MTRTSRARRPRGAGRRFPTVRLGGAGSRQPGFWLYAGHLSTIWGIALSNVFLGLALLWSGFRRRTLRWDGRTAAALLVPLGMYVIFLAESVLFSLEPATSASHLREVLSLTTLPLAFLLVRGEAEVRRIFDLLILMTVLISSYAIGQYYFTDYGPLHNRIPGPFSHYMTLSGVLLLGELLVIGRIISDQSLKRPWHWLALVTLSWALLLNLTRGTWIAVTVTLTVYFLVRARRFLPVFLASAVLLVWLAPDSVVARVRSIADLREESNYDRLCMLEAGLYMISERPLYGLGPGMVRHRYPIYRHPTAPRPSVSHLHNTYLQLAAERGLPALGAYLWLMAAALWLAHRGYRREGGPKGRREDLYLGAILVLVGFSVAGLFEDNWRDTEVQRLVLFFLAVPACLASGIGEREPGDYGDAGA